MTNSAYQAKNWLMRAEALEDERNRLINRIALIESRVNNAVVHYDSSGGGHDRISSQAAHEDMLIEYSEALDRLEKVTNRVIHEDIISINTIDRLNNTKYCTLLIARYVARKSMKTIIEENIFNYERSHLYKMEHKALDALGSILNSGELREIPQPIKAPA